MPPSFANHWVVSFDGAEIARTIRRENTCRDGAYSYPIAYITSFAQKHLVNKAGISPNITRAAFVAQYHSRLSFEAMIAQDDPTGELLSYTVPRLTMKMQNKFPTVKFTPFTDEAFGPRISGVLVEGNEAVPEAWYWAAMIIRCSAGKEDFTWKDVNELIGRYYPADIYYYAAGIYKKEWELLSTSDRIIPWHMLYYGYGPSNTRTIGPFRPYEGADTLMFDIPQVNNDQST